MTKSDPGLRIRKKAETRARIASVASDLFGRDGFENTTMVQIAAAAGVSEQTVYNYFPVKEALVFDLQEELDALLLAAVFERKRGTSVVQAFRSWLHAALPNDALLRAFDSPGGMPALVAGSDGLRRHWLSRNDETARAIAEGLVEREAWPRMRALVVGRSLVAVHATFLDALGSGEAADVIDLDALRSQIDDALDALEHGHGRSLTGPPYMSR